MLIYNRFLFICSNSLFFFKILDEVYTILNYIKNTPCLERPYRVTDELFDLSTMAMEYFRDRIEPTLPDIAYFNKDFFKLHTPKRRNTQIKLNIFLNDFLFIIKTKLSSFVYSYFSGCL